MSGHECNKTVFHLSPALLLSTKPVYVFSCVRTRFPSVARNLGVVVSPTKGPPPGGDSIVSRVQVSVRPRTEKSSPYSLDRCRYPLQAWLSLVCPSRIASRSRYMIESLFDQYCRHLDAVHPGNRPDRPRL